MSSIDFEADDQGARNNVLYSKFQSSSQKPRIVDFLIRKGIAKTESQANVILLATIVVLIVVSIFLFRYNSYQNQPITPEQLIQLKTI
jgi:hypothetical protein